VRNAAGGALRRRALSIFLSSGLPCHASSVYHAAERGDRSNQGQDMEALINLGRLLMVGWVVYALLLIFAPKFIHQAPNLTSGIVQFLVAFLLGHLLDRALGTLRRRAKNMEAGEFANDTPSSDADAI
jgi:hypothetical protein